MFQDIQSILPANLKKAGVAGKVGENRILALYRQAIRKYLSPEQAARVRPLAWENRVIMVASLEGAATRVIKEQEAEIIRIINDLTGEEAVKSVRYLT